MAPKREARASVANSNMREGKAICNHFRQRKFWRRNVDTQFQTPLISGVTEEEEHIIKVSDNDQLELCIAARRDDPKLVFCLRIPANLEDLKQRAEAAGFKVEVEP
ncbi:uncharacterized protein LOC116246133 [Nymphaea colorata]|nr:uncharacterized protein LOC116246133 [Nymphaea colorata]